MKKLLIVAALAGVGYLVYRQVMASRAEEDLWTEATAAPDLGGFADEKTETVVEVVESEKTDES